jgi:hypothetical protein
MNEMDEGKRVYREIEPNSRTYGVTVAAGAYGHRHFAEV